MVQPFILALEEPGVMASYKPETYSAGKIYGLDDGVTPSKIENIINDMSNEGWFVNINNNVPDDIKFYRDLYKNGALSIWRLTRQLLGEGIGVGISSQKMPELIYHDDTISPIRVPGYREIGAVVFRPDGSDFLVTEFYHPDEYENIILESHIEETNK